MKKPMTPLQADIFNLSQTRNLGDFSLRQIGSLLGDEHPYAVQLAIKRLVSDGRLIQNKRTRSLTPSPDYFTTNSMINIPIFGRVSCGIPTELADEGPSGFVTVSPSIVDTSHRNSIFALIAAGDSMNRASINGKSVDDGDYVVVRKSEWSWGGMREGEYVVSRINETYNLKKIHIDHEQQRIVLLSESSEPYEPIFIAVEDSDYYDIECVAIDVIKGVKI